MFDKKHVLDESESEINCQISAFCLKTYLFIGDFQHLLICHCFATTVILQISKISATIDI